MQKVKKGGNEVNNLPYIPEYIKNPIMTTLLGGNFSLPLCKMLESIIVQLQDRIEEHLRKEDMGALVSVKDVMPVSESDPSDFGMLKFEIPIRTLGIPSQNYQELEEACNAIMKMQFTYRTDDKYEVTNVFHKVTVLNSSTKADGNQVQYKSGVRRTGIVEIKMHIDSAKEILTLKKGYVEHIFGIPQLCRSPRTHRLYVYLSAWLEKGGRDYPYNELKEWLGVVQYDSSHKNIISDSYKKYSEFSRAVLKPAQVEMKRLSDEGKVDFYFDYEPIYPPGKTKGNPYAIRFTTHINESGRMNAQGRFLRGIHSKLINLYKITNEEWESVEPMLSVLSQEKINSGINHLNAQMKKAEVKHPNAYAIKILKDWASKQEQDYVAFVQEESDNPEEVLWGKLAGKAMEWKADWWNIYGVCAKSLGIEDGQLVIDVPSSFVIDQWSEQSEFVRSAVKEIWGVDKIVFKLPG